MIARNLLGLLFLACVSGCSVRAETGPGYIDERAGALVLDWSIDGFKDPNLCDLSDADTLDVTVAWADGQFAGEFQQSCRAFAMSIDLEPGSYRAEAVLLDFAGHERTTVVPIGSFDIYGNDELDIPIDFPAASFY